MDPKMAILALPAALVVAGLVLHSLKTRGRRDTAFFFLFALLFGILRGNTIWWITTVHFGGDFPYIFKSKLIGVFHDSIVADMGWILCLYIGSYLAVTILERMEALKGRLFATVSLACLFNATLSYAVEATAIEMGWWGWTLNVHSDLLRDVPMAGIVAWFSVGFDFLVPFFLIRYYRKPGQIWPWFSLLIFPLHMLTHLSNTRVSDALPIVPYNIWHWGMVLLTLFLPFVSRMRFSRPWLESHFILGGPVPRENEVRLPGFVMWLPMLGVFTVMAVLFVSDLLLVRSPDLATTKASLVYFVLLSLPWIPAWVVLAIALALAAVGGQVFWVPLLVPGFYFALKGYALWPRLPWLKLAYVAVPLVMTWSYYDWSVDKHEQDRQYWVINEQGARLMEAGQVEQALPFFDEAIALKPDSIKAYQNLFLAYVNLQRLDDALAAMNALAAMRPVNEEIQENIGSVHLMRGDLDAAEAAFTRALELDPKSAYSREMLEEIARLRREGAKP